MFRDIKDRLDSPAVRQILAECVFDDSPEGIAGAVAAYRRHAGWQFYGWMEEGTVLGVCGFEAHADYVEIIDISVAGQARGRGIGSAMVAALQEKYNMPVGAETGDGAVGFYRKCGFAATEIRKYGVRRWACVLPAPEREA